MLVVTIMRRIIIILITFFSVINVTAQTPEIGVFGGGAYYIGDLNGCSKKKGKSFKKRQKKIRT